jgi:hypothetical protein
MRSVATSAALCISSFAALTTPASACSCARGDDAEMQKLLRTMLLEQHAVLVEVEAVQSRVVAPQIETTSFPVAVMTSFEVRESWWGSSGKEIKVMHRVSSAACGLTFKPGDRLLLLAGPTGGFQTNACSQNLASRAQVWGKAQILQLLKSDK